MNEIMNPEQRRMADIEQMTSGIVLLDRDLKQLYDLHEAEDIEFARDEIQEQIDELKGKLFEKRNSKENTKALRGYIADHAEEYQELIEMGLPVDEYSIAYDAFQTEKISEEYLEILRREITELVEE
ncbi:MAG: hypothetical protein WCP14_03825 [bacterium]